MDAINIPEAQVVPLEQIAQGIEGLRIVFVNVFGISHPNGSWTLIDSGLPFSEHLIRKWADKHFGTAPNAIVLTHGHFDHVSSAQALANHWNVPVYAHPLERPYLNGEREYPPPNFAAGGGIMTLLSPLLPRGPVNLGTRLHEFALGTDTDIAVDAMPGWKIIHTPGHTPGHISLFRESDRTLLVGDAFCTTKPESFFEAAIKQEPELHGPPAYFTSDWKQARESLRVLAKLEPLTVAPGHGRPIAAAGVPALLRELASRFEEIAVPNNRKSAA